MPRCAGWAITAGILFSPSLVFSQNSAGINLPFDPVMGLSFRPAQIAFERAPAYLVLACTKPAREKFWIYAETSRPEGRYMVIAGPVWTVPDTSAPSKPVLDPIDSYGEVVLFKDGRCTPIGDPDTMFNAPQPSQKGIVGDLAKDLIHRAIRAYGGRAPFMAALKTQGLTTDKVDPILQPLIAQP